MRFFFQCKIHLRSRLCRRKRRPTCKSLAPVGRASARYRVIKDFYGRKRRLTGEGFILVVHASARYRVIKDIYGRKRRLTGEGFTPVGRALARQSAKLSTRLTKRRNK